MTLGDAKVGSTVVVTKIEGDSAYKRRIMDMGITKGSELYIRKVAPLGDPVEITVRGYELSVRKDDAQCVQVKQDLPKELTDTYCRIRIYTFKEVNRNGNQDCTCGKPKLW